MSYFCFNYRNTFFIHAMNYFSVVLRIIFPMCIKNYFLIGPWIIFRGIANFFFGLQCIAGLVFEVDWFESLTSLGDHFERGAFKENVKARHCQGKKRKRFSSFLQNLSGASSLCVSDEVFWTEDLIEEITKRLHDSYTILTLTEHDMCAQLNSSLPNLIPRVFVPYYTCLLSERRRCEWECPLPWTSGRISRL